MDNQQNTTITITGRTARVLRLPTTLRVHKAEYDPEMCGEVAVVVSPIDSPHEKRRISITWCLPVPIKNIRKAREVHRLRRET